MMSGPVALPRTDHRELVASTVVPKQRVGLSEVGVERHGVLSTSGRRRVSPRTRRRERSAILPRLPGGEAPIPAQPVPGVVSRVAFPSARSLGSVTRAGGAVMLLAAVVSPAWLVPAARAATYFVRQTVGDDSNDGLTPATAWKHFSRLSPAMNAGDTAFVGPGLYREQVSVEHDGTPEGHLTFIADTTGQHTGDPPGVVMVAGSEPVDEQALRARRAAGGLRGPVPGLEGVGRGRDGRPPAALRERPDHAREPGGEDAAGGHRREAAVELVLRRRDAGAHAAHQRRAAAGRARDGAHPPRRRHLHPGEARRDRGRLHLPAHAGRGGELLHRLRRRRDRGRDLVREPAGDPHLWRDEHPSLRQHALPQRELGRLLRRQVGERPARSATPPTRT